MPPAKDTPKGNHRNNNVPMTPICRRRPANYEIELESESSEDGPINDGQSTNRLSAATPTATRYGLRPRQIPIFNASRSSKQRRGQTPKVTTTPRERSYISEDTPSRRRLKTPSEQAMSSQTGKWREEQVLIICPGSQTTLAQLGCHELTPPAHRFPTRMFKDNETNDWRPYHTFKRKKGSGLTNGASAIANLALGDGNDDDDDNWEWVEDTDSTEGAVYPLQGGRIVNMKAFLAFLDHVHSQLTTTYHNTPIMLMASPQWARSDVETITGYIFEKTRTPALCIMHSGLATQYGLKWPNVTVVDIGYEKVDVTCVYEGSVVNNSTLGFPCPERAISGGEVFTQKLLKLLEDKDFTYDMAEQLKKSHICEVLPYNPDLDALMELPTASTAGAPAGPVAPEPAKLPEAAKPAIESEEGVDEPRADEDGVLDVASIVTSGNTREFLAKKEKEKGDKGDKGKGRKAKAQEVEPAKPMRLPNSKRTHNVFHYEEVIQEEVFPEAPATNGTNGANGATAVKEASENKDVEMKDAPETAPATAEAKTDEPKADEPKAGEPKAASSATPAEVDKPAEITTEGDKAAAETVSTVETTESNEKAPEAALETAASAPSMNTQSAEKINDADIKSETTPAPAPAAPAPAEPATSTSTASAVAAVPQEPRIENKRVRRDIEVGLERFKFADRDEIDRIVTTIYRTIQGINEMYMRPSCWDNLVFVGNGARLRGLKENIIQRLIARHLISPSTATMFTSELPSNIATPTGTGSQTPTSSYAGMPHQLPNASSGVNPLLQAATTASGYGTVGAPGTPGAQGEMTGQQHHSTHFHSQTPTSIKQAVLPTYLAEWTKHGFEEAMFLGAQVASRLAFCVHNLDMAGLDAQKQMSLSRVDYNELGPKGIRNHSMLS